MKIKVNRDILHDTAGLIRAGEVAEVPEPWASRFIERGHAEKYETKVVREAPAEPAEKPKPSAKKAPAKKAAKK